VLRLGLPARGRRAPSCRRPDLRVVSEWSVGPTPPQLEYVPDRLSGSHKFGRRRQQDSEKHDGCAVFLPTGLHGNVRSPGCRWKKSFALKPRRIEFGRFWPPNRSTLFFSRLKIWCTTGLIVHSVYRSPSEEKRERPDTKARLDGRVPLNQHPRRIDHG
jgi:hypothetical protein